MKRLLLLLSLLIVGIQAYSTHIIGGEMSYSYMGNNNYEFTLTLYRDCYNGIAPFDNPAAIGIFNSSNTLTNSIAVPLQSISDITNSSGNCLPVAPSGICVEKGIYTFSVSLPPLPGGYQIVYQRCCRPVALVNIPPISTGMTIKTNVPDSLYYQNNSPVFINPCFTFICQNTNFSFDNSATDSDGDSIAYALITPLEGATNTNPMPSPPFNPPYSGVNWMTPYSLSNVFGGIPLTLDPNSGLLSCKPNSTGLFAFAISAKEYRNGVFLNETTRDFQTYIVQNTAVSEITSPDLIQIYPTINSGTFKIELDQSLNLNDCKIQIIDLNGKIIDTKFLGNKKNFLFENKNITNGLYFIKIFEDDALLKTGKLIIQQ